MKTVDLLHYDGKLPSEQSIKLNEVTKLIFKSKKVIILTGAGISCNAGIPDFRSADGLYNLIQSNDPKNFIKGKDLFDISLFRDELTLQIFCKFMEGLYNSSLMAKPTETHKFIKILKDKKKLLRCYTQNIDCLESNINLKCGIDAAKFDEKSNKNFTKEWKDLDVVQLHGNLHKLSCTQCFKNFDWTPDHQYKLKNGENPECENCYIKYQQRLYSGKRLTGNIGILRPDIVLYGENHPQSEILTKGLNIDLNMKSDLLVIMGTSLKVDGVKNLVKSLCKKIHEKGGYVIFINKTPLSKQWASYIDYEILCDCDHFVRILKAEIPDLFLTQEQLDSKKLKMNQQQSTPPSTPKSSKIVNIKDTKKLNSAKIKKELKKELNGVKKEVKRVTVKKELNKVTVKKELPLDTKKVKKEPRPTLKASTQVKKEPADFLPTPMSSFNEDVEFIESKPIEPLKPLTKSQLNQRRRRLDDSRSLGCKRVKT